MSFSYSLRNSLLQLFSSGEAPRQKDPSEETLLLRMPSLGPDHIAFCYGSDIWVTDRDGENLRRITNNPSVDSAPAISPDGNTIAFTSNRSGTDSVYVVDIGGGTPRRLTWHPSGAQVCGWSPDGKEILYASSREYAPKPSKRIWAVPLEGGNSRLISRQRGVWGSYSPDQSKIVLDVVTRWESEFRAYRGGQNTPLLILDLKDHSELMIPCERTIDIQPVWIGNFIYFLSDRDGGVSNIWSYSLQSGKLSRMTNFKGADVKWLSGRPDMLAFEHQGRLHLLDLGSGRITTLNILVRGDFPWADPKWENVTYDISDLSVSSSGKRLIVEARGEIFTVPAEHGEVRNISQSPGSADRKPLWSPKGDQIAWFSDQGFTDYVLKRASQDGMKRYDDIPLGDSKFAWEPCWSPDGRFIAFTDNKVRVRVIDLSDASIETVGMGGIDTERGHMGLGWSPDSSWLMYTRRGDNRFSQIMLYSMRKKTTHALTNSFADAYSPVWDRGGRHIYFLASTNVALRSGLINTSAMTSKPAYAPYVVNLVKSDPSPFELLSDEETPNRSFGTLFDTLAELEEEDEILATETEEEVHAGGDEEKNAEEHQEDEPVEEEDDSLQIDFDGIDRRIMPLPMQRGNYRYMLSGPPGCVFVAEHIPMEFGYRLHRFVLPFRASTPFARNVYLTRMSGDGEVMFLASFGNFGLTSVYAPEADPVNLDLRLDLFIDRTLEWKQIFEEAWRYLKDYFYDPNMHGRDWDQVYLRYAPLIPHVKHRSDLDYVLDQMNGEISAGHSFVYEGDYPYTEVNKVGMLGADFSNVDGYWRIDRIYTTEHWNPELSSPLDHPGLQVEEGNFLVGINGRELPATENLFQRLDGTLFKQTVLHINDKPGFEDAWTIQVKPIWSENALRQRAWVEDNRRWVDKASGGRLGYVWVPDTRGHGLISFNRYFFAQQDKLGAVIDERYNSGGLLDDYMVDLMTREPRAAVVNEVQGGKHWILPAGILGPKALLINENAGSGGDYFPWVFRQQNAGPLIGTRTWGGLLTNHVHYAFIDGGAMTAPDGGVFDPRTNEWIAENVGVAPDIEVRMDTVALEHGRDPQLERAVEELLKVIPKAAPTLTPPPFPNFAKPKD